MGNRPPHTFQPGLTSSPTHPLMSTLFSIWLLFILIKRQPPKAKAPPLSLLFDASYFASLCEQTNNSERNPDSLRPAHCVGERRHHDLVASLLYPWRGREQSRWRVGWHGSSCWLLCLCVLCFVFCAASKQSGVIECHHISYFEKWKLWAMFFGGFLCQSNYDQKKGTVVWPSVGINLRWPFVMSKYEYHQSQFNLWKFLLGFFILQKQWDPNFLLLCISFLHSMDLTTTLQSRSFLKNIKNFLCK